MLIYICINIKLLNETNLNKTSDKIPHPGRLAYVRRRDIRPTRPSTRPDPTRPESSRGEARRGEARVCVCARGSHYNHAHPHALVVVHYTCMLYYIKQPTLFYQINVGLKFLQLKHPHNTFHATNFYSIYLWITLRKLLRSKHESLSPHTKEQPPTIRFWKLH